MTLSGVLQPSSVAMDFEQSAFQPVQEAFPNAQLFGCLFHLVKNLKKQLREADLATRYKNDADFALEARMIVALAFVPLDALDDVLEALEGLDSDLEPVTSWFEVNYVGM